MSFKIVGIGTIVETMTMNDRFAKVQIVKGSYGSKSVSKKKKGKNIDMENKDGNVKTTVVATSDYVMAQYLNLGNTSQYSAPRLSAGSQVLVFTIGRDNNYFFVDYLVSFEDRLPEEFTHIYGVGPTTNPLEDCYRVTMSPRNKEVRLDTTATKGEQCAWHVGLDTGSGKFYIEDDKRNFLRVDGGTESLYTYFNKDYLGKFEGGIKWKVLQDYDVETKGDYFFNLGKNYFLNVNGDLEQVVKGNLVSNIKGGLDTIVEDDDIKIVKGATLLSSNGIEITGNNERVKIHSSKEVTISATSINLIASEVNLSGLLRAKALSIGEDIEGDKEKISPVPREVDQEMLKLKQDFLDAAVELPELQGKGAEETLMEKVYTEESDARDTSDEEPKEITEEDEEEEKEEKEVEEVNEKTDCKDFKLELEGGIELKGKDILIEASGGMTLDGKNGLMLKGGGGQTLDKVLGEIYKFLTEFVMAPAIPGKPIYAEGAPKIILAQQMCTMFTGNPNPPQIEIPDRVEVMVPPEPTPPPAQPAPPPSSAGASGPIKEYNLDEITEGKKDDWVLHLDRRFIVRDFVRADIRNVCGGGNGFRVEDMCIGILRLVNRKDPSREFFRCVTIENGKGDNEGLKGSSVSGQDYRIPSGVYSLKWRSSSKNHNSALAMMRDPNKKHYINTFSIKETFKKGENGKDVVDKRVMAMPLIDGPKCKGSRTVLMHEGSAPQHSEGCILITDLKDISASMIKTWSTPNNYWSCTRNVGPTDLCTALALNTGDAEGNKNTPPPLSPYSDSPAMKNLVFVITEDNLRVCPGNPTTVSNLANFFQNNKPTYAEPVCRFKELVELSKTRKLTKEDCFKNAEYEKLNKGKGTPNFHRTSNLFGSGSNNMGTAAPETPKESKNFTKGIYGKICKRFAVNKNYGVYCSDTVSPSNCKLSELPYEKMVEYFNKYGLTTPEAIASFLSQACVESSGFIDTIERTGYRVVGVMNSTFKKFFYVDNHDLLGGIHNPAAAKMQDNFSYGSPKSSLIPKKPITKYLKTPGDPSMDDVKLFNYVYGMRMGNGPESSGDGYKYRGRGFIQLTGKSNYEVRAKELGKVMGDDFLNWLTTTEGALVSALAYFKARCLTKIPNKNTAKLALSMDLSLKDIRENTNYEKLNNGLKPLTKSVNGGTNHHHHRVIAFIHYYKMFFK